MPDQRRRRSYTNDYSLSGDEHSFLTPRGLWLQQNSRVDLPQGIPLPSSAPGQSGIPTGLPNDMTDLPVDGSSSRSRAASPPLLGRFQETPLDVATMQNLRAAKRFPDLADLRRRPLTAMYRAALATDSMWQTYDPDPVVDADASRRDATSSIQQAARAIGKLVIRLPGQLSGQFASGSAFVTGPNTIMTCAHNLFDSNERQWSRGLEFYPGYDFYSSQKRPACRVVSGTIPRAYLDNPLTNHDIAVCRVDMNIGDLIGTELPIEPVAGIEFFDTHHVDIMGYPAGSGFDFGKQLWRSRGHYLFGVSGGGGDDYAPTIATNFGGGASGCPWVYRVPETGRCVAVGITSGHAKLRYDLAEPNLLSLTSALMTDRNLDRLNDDFVEHQF